MRFRQVYWFDFGEGVVPLALFYTLTIMEESLSKQFEKFDEYRIHMETFLSAPLIDFDIPLRILIPLENAGIKRLRDLVSLTREELLAVPRLGIVAVEHLEKLLSHYDLSLKKKRGPARR